MNKRVFSVLLVMAVCLSMVLTGVWALEGNSSEQGTKNIEAFNNVVNWGGNDIKEYASEISLQAVNNETDLQTNGDTEADVAKIGETTYTSLQEAFNAAEDGDTITLQKNIDDTVASATEVFVFDHEGQTVTLDMNGKSISGVNNWWKGSLVNVKSGKLIMKNTSSEFITISQGNNMSAAAVLVSGGAIQFENKVRITGQLKVTGDGKLEGGLPVGSLLIYNNKNNTVSVESSNIYKFGTDPQIVALLGDSYAFARCDENGELDNNGASSESPVLCSGSSTERNVKVVAHPTCTLKEQSDNTYRCDCGRPCPHTSTDSNGNCAACGKEPEAKIGESYQWTLQEALVAVQDGETITLLKDYNGAATYNKSGAITIDLNGKTWEYAYGTPLTINSGNVTLKNGKVLGGESGKNQRGIFVAANAGLTLNDGMIVKGTGGYITGPGSGSFTQGIFLNSVTSQLKLAEGTVIIGGMYLSNSRVIDSILLDGTALVECSCDENTGNVTIQKDENGNNKFITEAQYINGDMTVVEHTHEFDDNGTCVCGLTAAAQVNGTIYQTITEAVEAAKDGGTIKLITSEVGSNSETFTVDKDKTVTIDLNGKKLVSPITVLGTINLTNNSEKAGIASNITLGDGTTDGKLEIENDKVNVTTLTVANKEKTLLPKDVGYSKIECTGGLTLGELLPEPDAGGNHYAFWNGRTNKYNILRSEKGFNLAADSSYAYIKICDSHGAWTDDGLCGYCGYACKHGSDDNNGNCATCGVKLAAFLKKDTGEAAKAYENLSDAIAEANNVSGSTLMLLQNITDTPNFISTGTWTLDMHGHTLPNTDFIVQSGILTINNQYAGTVGKLKSVTVKSGGKLKTVSHTASWIEGIDTVTVEADGGASLDNGTYGKIENQNSNGTLHDLLAGDRAFADGNDKIINSYNTKTATNVKVIVHNSHTIGIEGGSCECGFSCTKHNFEKGVCKNCGYACPHENVTETGLEGHKTAACDTCGQQMVVKVKSGDTTTYYMQSTNSGVDNTLRTILNGADGRSNGYAENGSTITLLTDGLNANAVVNNSRSITLDLNGKKLIETDGIRVEAGSKLTVTGEGSSSEDDNFMWPCVFNVQGGTLEFKEFYFGGTFNSIRVGSGTLTSARDTEDAVKIGTLEIGSADAKVSFKQGTFEKIVFSGNSGRVTLGDLLQKSYGNAFRYVNENDNLGDYVLYNTEITQDKPIKNVKIAACFHDSLGAENTCDYCGWAHLVAIYMTDSGTVGTLTPAATWTEDAINKVANTAFGTWNSMGGTLKLFTGFALTDRTITNRNATHIDLNGNKITGGTLTLDKNNSGKGANVTITDSSAGKTGSFANVTVNGGASLTVDGVSVGKITAADKSAKVTLKEGSSFTGYELPAGMILADCLPADCCVLDANNNVIDVLATNGTGNFVVKKIPASITAENKTGSILYGGTVPENLRPVVKMDEGETVPQLTYEWRYKTSDGFQTLPSTTANAGENLDAYCIITAKDSSGKTLWAASVTGYTLTVTKAPATVDTAPAKIENLVYNGSERALVTAGSTRDGKIQYSLTKDGTYTENIPTGTNADTYTVWYKVVGDSNHEDSQPESVEVKIAKKELSISNFTIEAKTYDETTNATVTGVEFTGLVDGETLNLGTDFTATAEFDNANAGGNKSVTLTVTTKESSTILKNYELISTTFNKDGFAIAKATPTVSAEDKTVVYDGSPVSVDEITKTARLNGADIAGIWNWKSGEKVTDVADSGEKTLVFTPTDTTNFNSVETKATLTISKADSVINITNENALNRTYNNKAVDATYTASGDGKVTVEYYKDNTKLDKAPTDAGTYKVVVKQADGNNYSAADAEATFTIAQCDIAKAIIELGGSLTYNRSEQTQEISSVKVGELNVTYTASGNTGTNAGKYVLTVTGTGNFTGTATKDWNIAKKQVDNPTIEIAPGSKYNGSEQTPSVTVKDDTETIDPKEYIVSYSNNINAGTGTVTITSSEKSNYVIKESSKDFEIAKADATCTAPTAEILTYNGKDQELVKAGTTADGTILYSKEQNGTYSDTIPTGKNADNYTVWYMVKGDDNHNNTAPESVSVTIAKADVTITAKDKTVYVGDKAPDLSNPKADKDYTISGLLGEDKLTIAPTLTYDPANPDTSKIGDAATINITGDDTEGNYTITYVAGKLTVANRPAGGGVAEDDVKTTTDNTTSETTTSTTIRETKTETVKDETGKDVTKTTATVSDKVADKLVDQAVSNNSDTVEITVKSNTENKVDSEKQTELEIPKSAVKEIADKTDASLVINTDNGQVALDSKALKTIASETEGDTVRIVVNENTQLKESQEPAADVIKSGRLFDISAYIGSKRIHDLRGGSVTVMLPIPEKLKGKDVVVIYINDKGICEILNHTVETIGTDIFAKFTATHFSNFAVIDKTEADSLIKQQNQDKAKELIKEAKLKATTAKTSKKNVKVTVKADNSLIKELKDMGYTVKYKYYRSTKKASKYTAVKTKTTNTYINTKGKKGTRYYYKARVLVYEGKKLIAQTELKQCSYGARVWSK